MGQLLEDPYLDLGGGIAAKELFDEDSIDLKTQLLKIKAVNPDAIFFVSLADITPALIKQIKEMGIEQPLFTNISIQNYDVVKTLGKNGDGIVYLGVKKTKLNSNNLFDQNFPYFFARNFASWGFDSVMIVNKAIGEVGGDKEKVTDYLRNLKNYQGAFGNISFDEYGELELEYEIYEIRDEGFRVWE